MVKKKKLPYWDRRAIDQDIKVHDELNVIENKVMKSYQKAQSYLTDEVKKIYRRYLAKSDLSEEEINKILNTSSGPASIAELQTIVKTVKDPGIKKQAQDYLTGMAVKSRITRLEDLKAKSYLVSKQVADVQLSRSTDYYIDVIKEAYNQASVEAIIGKSESALRLYDDGRYPTYTFNDEDSFIVLRDSETNKKIKTFKLKDDKDIPEFKEMSTKQVRNVLDTNWEGSNYSKRIWGDTDLLAEKLQELFTVEAMTGMSERDMVKEIQKVFDVSRGVARRLIRTEANYMAGQGKLKGWIEQGVEYYVIVATLDLRTSKICQDQNGKRYKVSEAKVGINFPPFHPWCRTVVRAWFNEKTLSGKRFANDPISGKQFGISYADSYKKWEQMLIDQHGKENLKLARKKVKNFNVDLKQFNRYKSAIGLENTPKTLDDFQDMKYNEGNNYTELKSLYRDVKWQKDAFSNSYTKSENKVPFTSVPNSVADELLSDGIVKQRRFYGKTGQPRFDIDYTDHGNPKHHKTVPHVHDWTSYERKTGQLTTKREKNLRELSTAEKIVEDWSEKNGNDG